MTHREDVLVRLLERFGELTDPVRAGNGDGQTGLLLMPLTYTATVREVERLLCVMRNDRHRALIVLDDGAKVSVRSLWWQLNERYLVSTQRTCWKCPKCGGLTHAQSHNHRDRRGKLCAYQGVRALETVYDPSVQMRRVDRGVRWLADEWGLKTEPMIPKHPLDPPRVAA